MIKTCQKDKMIRIIDIGVIEYKKAYNLQREFIKRRSLNLIPDTLILLEHPPVFTIGRRGLKENLLIDEDELKRCGIELISVDRGGDITFHGPGQLVLYPILDLSTQRDLHLYIRSLEDVMLDFLSQYDVAGIRIPGATGVWIDKDTKIGFVGIGISKWITYHGLSININTPLFYFDMIRPCGLTSCKVTSLFFILKRYIKMDEAKGYLIESFKKVFSYEEISMVDKKEIALF